MEGQRLKHTQTVFTASSSGWGFVNNPNKQQTPARRGGIKGNGPLKPAQGSPRQQGRPISSRPFGSPQQNIRPISMVARPLPTPPSSSAESLPSSIPDDEIPPLSLADKTQPEPANVGEAITEILTPQPPPRPLPSSKPSPTPPLKIAPPSMGPPSPVLKPVFGSPLKGSPRPLPATPNEVQKPISSSPIPESPLDSPKIPPKPAPAFVFSPVAQFLDDEDDDPEEGSSFFEGSEVEIDHTVLEKSGYVIGDTIGKGAFAVVKKAVKEKTEYAIKMVNKQATFQFNEDALKNEIQILKEVDHENLLTLFESLESENHTFLVFECLYGGELLYQITSENEEKRPYTETDARRIILQILKAITYL